MLVFDAPRVNSVLWVEVWVDSPGSQGCYIYRCPDDLPLQVGDILAVPFGTQVVGAVAVRILENLPEDLDPGRVRPIEEVIDRGILPPEFWSLLQRVADYYLTPFIQVLRTVLPPGLLTRSQRRIRLISTPVTPLRYESATTILTRLQSSKNDLAWSFLRQRIPDAEAGLRELLKLQLVESYWHHPSHPPAQTATGGGLAPGSAPGTDSTATRGGLGVETVGGRGTADGISGAIRYKSSNDSNPGT